MVPSNAPIYPAKENGETFFRILTLLVIGFAAVNLWNSHSSRPSLENSLTPEVPSVPQDSVATLVELSEEIRTELFTLGLRLDVLEQGSSELPVIASSSSETAEELAKLPKETQALPPLSGKEAQALMGKVQQQIKTVDSSLGWSDLLLRRLHEDNPLGMSRAVYQALNERFTNYYEVTRAIRQEIYDVWSSDPAAVGRDPRPILAMLNEIESEWEYLDEELQEFLSPDEYTGFTRLVKTAQREQTVMSYLDRQQETEQED
ncbi:MAG: hypothetical protein CBC13_09680 [Planctomycetia bacterium TMED53]|nr:MAG: hypothetical protein CBC13_09680 [Planctomycetia bacterium TMED53]